MTTTITKQILIVMDNILDKEEKWCQGPAYGPNNSMCLFFGAIHEARIKLGLEGTYLPHTEEYKILERLATSHHSGPVFNDDPRTTFRDIKDLLARAIKEA